MTSLRPPPVSVRKPEKPTPLIVDSPHSGRLYPADFAFMCDVTLLRQAEDFYVDELIAGACEAGATVITASFPRSYIDVNRAVDDIDAALLDEPWPTPLQPSAHTAQGLGLVRRMCRSRVPVYAKPLSIDQVQRRIADYYTPYHQALHDALQTSQRLFGVCYLIDAHSMPDAEERLARRPDFVLGDRNGTSCDPAFTRHVCEYLREMGYTVALNEPYQGREIVRRYGEPERDRHALQLEINRRLYMDEARLEKHQGFSRLRHDLSELFQAVVTEISRDNPLASAAE